MKNGVFLPPDKWEQVENELKAKTLRNLHKREAVERDGAGKHRRAPMSFAK